MSKALLYDSTVCIGCKQCEQACAEQNKLPYDDAIAKEEIQSAHKLTVVLTRDDKFMRRLCMNSHIIMRVSLFWTICMPNCTHILCGTPDG